jgi:hypothetical protein
MQIIKGFHDFRVKPSDNLKYHLDNRISILENIFRPESDSFYEVIKESRNFIHLLSDLDRKIFENSDIGKFEYFNGKLVPLDLPLLNDQLNESEYNGKEVKLNYPTRSTGPKKYKVYVKNPKTGKVIKVNFGDVKGGLSAKVNDPKARKAFADRHKCSQKKDKTKAGYWACRLPKYKHLVNTSYNGYW